MDVGRVVGTHGKLRIMIQLYKGDCLEVMKLIPDGSVDAIITDPPYGTTACKWDSVVPFDKMWAQLNRIIKPNGVIVLFGSEPFSSALRMSNIKNYKYDWIWNKISGANFMNLKNRPWKTQEQLIVFFNEANITFNPKRVPRTAASLKRLPAGESRKYVRCESNSIAEHYGMKHAGRNEYTPKGGLKHPIDIIEFNRREKNPMNIKHPTKKPVALMEYLVKTYTNENETVLDFTMGSGSTGVACKNTNRRFIGIELDDNYFEIAEKRIEEAKTNQLTIQPI